MNTAAFLFIAATAFAQQPAFEVASIKPADPNPQNAIMIGMSADGSMVRYTNISLRNCIRAAWRVRTFQIEGPDWLDTTRFNITAKLPPGTQQDQIPEMLQVLLAERFKLTVRHDSKEENVYVLTVGKGGAKLKPTELKADENQPKALGTDGKPRAMMMFRYQAGGAALTAPSASVSSLTELMSRFTERPVVDMTGIQGQYDWALTFAPEITSGIPNLDQVPETPKEPQPSLFDAVQKYGLKLEARRAPLEIITVTHIEKIPTEN